MTASQPGQSEAVERGRQAIEWMLDLIGDGDATDHDIAKRLVDAELDIRAAIAALSATAAPGVGEPVGYAVIVGERPDGKPQPPVWYRPGTVMGLGQVKWTAIRDYLGGEPDQEFHDNDASAVAWFERAAIPNGFRLVPLYPATPALGMASVPVEPMRKALADMVTMLHARPDIWRVLQPFLGPAEHATIQAACDALNAALASQRSKP